MVRSLSYTLLLFLAALSGCRQTLIRRTDRQVHGLIQSKQIAALGETSDIRLGAEDGLIGPTGEMYSFTPRSLAANLPPGFERREVATAEDEAEQEPFVPETIPTDEPEDPAAETAVDDLPEDEPPAADLLTPDIFTPEELDEVETFGLRDSIRYALRHGRDLQNDKEDLYLAALALTLERHLWTPQFSADFSASFTDFEFGKRVDLDRAMTAVSTVAAAQRLPLGGTVTVSMLNTLVRDLRDRVTTGESGQIILTADIPLFRGAGRIAYESRYREERRLIYAVRRYERSRRAFVVDVAATYFGLQEDKAAIYNAYQSYLSRQADWEKAEFIKRLGRSRDVFDAPRAKSSFRAAESSLVSAKEAYASALDRFKILLGMSMDAKLDVVSQAEDTESHVVDMLMPSVDEGEAVTTALRYRLDLLTQADQVDDTRRGARNARNEILPDLAVGGDVTFDGDPDRRDSIHFESDRATWGANVSLSMDDRKAERNAYRSSLIDVRRAERDHEVAVDNVRADVRRSLRRVAQQDDLRLIQSFNVEENEFRRDAAKAQYDLGKITNRDKVEADEDLLRARNDYARALSAYRNAILQVRLATGTLRVSDEGEWGADQ